VGYGALTTDLQCLKDIVLKQDIFQKYHFHVV
jgi:hypothetical protein